MRGDTKTGLRIGFCAIIGVCLPRGAFGQTAASPADLFEKGKELMNAGDYAAGCPMIQQSYDLEPKLGRLYTLATCRDREGNIATALSLYRDFLTGVAAEPDPAKQQNHADREPIATERVRALEVEVPKLKLVWHGGVPKDVEVAVGGVDALTQINAEWPLDPGEYVVTIRRKDSAEQSRWVKLESGKPLVEVDLTPAPPEPPIKPKEEPIVQATTKPPNPEPKSPFLLSQRVVGWIWLGVAGAGGATAAVLGIKAAMKKSDVNESCKPMNVQFMCTPVGRVAAEETYALGEATTWTLVASGAIAVVGAVELWRGTQKNESPRATQMRLSVGRQQGFVTIEGRF